MSAILGIYQRHTPVDPEHLSKMLDTLSHRGSDGLGTWCQGCIGLGRRLLWTTPESLHEHCPLINSRGDLILTADARLDNRDFLIAALELTHSPVDQLSDGHLILSAYEKWGEACPQQLLGDFSFAIWDERQQQLFCGRDPFGVKPFYYYYAADDFVFATEIKALLSLPQVPRRLNETRVAEHLANLDNDPTLTLYQNILRLPPAHCLRINSAGLSLRPYWQLDANPQELQLGSNQDYASQFLELFTEAVRCRLRSAFPVGSMLSGGLDSSAITCVARQILNQRDPSQPLHTFSARFNQILASDERVYQEAVLAQGNYESHLLQGDQLGPFTDHQKVLWHRDAALLAGNFRLNWGLYKIAQQHNVRVILDGWDGDTTVSHGSEYLRELAQAGRWLTLAMETRAYGRRYQLPWFKVLLRWMWRYGLHPTFAPLIRPIKAMKSAPDLPQSEVNSLIDMPLQSAFVERIGLQEKLQNLKHPPPRTERENHYRLLMGNIHSSMFDLLDPAGGAFSVDLRFPFFDKRLIEFCLALPAHQKLSQGWGRWVMRNAMTGILPKALQWRLDKANMHPGFEYSFKTYEQSAMKSVLFEKPDIIAEYIDILALKEQYHRFMTGDATVSEVNALWRAVSLGLWLQYADITL